MVSAQLAVVLCLVSAPNDAVLYDFTAPWCGPCRAMEPTVAHLAASGLRVRKINVDQERDLANQFRVNSIPCFVLVKDGREVDRIVGPASAGELERMFAKAGAMGPPTGADAVRGQSPDEPLRRIAPNSAGHQHLLGDSGALAARTMPVSNPAPDANNPFRRAGAPAAGPAFDAPRSADFIKFCAKLSIEDKTGFSYGSGTIIDTRGDQALILTCGHIFRDSQGQGKIAVDLFVPGAPKKVPGQLVSYNLDRDVALVSIRPGVPVTAARVAPETLQLAQGDRVISVGCNNGGEPTAEDSHVLAINKFGGPPNVQTAGQPVQGRSGGGLFTQDGMVVGVCNAADPTDNAGLFAAAGAIYAELDGSRLSSIYRNPANPVAAAPINSVAPANFAPPVAAAAPRQSLVATEAPGPLSSQSTLPATPTAAELRAMATQTLAAQGQAAAATLSPQSQAALANLQQQADGAEVICIVRPRGAVQTKSEVIVLDRASTTFLDQLAQERTTQQSRRLTSLEVKRRTTDWRATGGAEGR